MKDKQEKTCMVCGKPMNAFDVWIITRDGSYAWNWGNPAERVNLENPDDFKLTHFVARDDRFEEGGNVWD